MTTLKVPVSSIDHIQGSKDASITLVKYGDYQCPYCRAAYYVVKQLQEQFGGELRFVFRNFPLNELHPFAEAAAETAEFANDHDLFWEMHDAIYENQSSLSLPFLLENTEKLGLSKKELEKAFVNKIYLPKVREDFMGGVKSGVNGTPTFYINNQRYTGRFDLESLASAIASTANG